MPDTTTTMTRLPASTVTSANSTPTSRARAVVGARLPHVGGPPPARVGYGWACPACDLTTGHLGSAGEAAQLAGVHDQIHHGGAGTAVLLGGTDGAQSVCESCRRAPATLTWDYPPAGVPFALCADCAPSAAPVAPAPHNPATPPAPRYPAPDRPPDTRHRPTTTGTPGPDAIADNPFAADVIADNPDRTHLLHFGPGSRPVLGRAIGKRRS